MPRLICWRPDDGAPFEVRRELTATERARIEARIAMLDTATRPFGAGDAHGVRAAIEGMFAGYRTMRQQGDEADAVVEVTLAVLREFPAWAIERGCLLIARGHASLDKRFAPNDAEIHGVIEGLVRSYRRDLETARGLLNARLSSAYRPKERPPSGQLAPVAAPRPAGRHPPPLPSGDGKHASRVAADLAARKARNETTSAPTA